MLILTYINIIVYYELDINGSRFLRIADAEYNYSDVSKSNK